MQIKLTQPNMQPQMDIKSLTIGEHGIQINYVDNIDRTIKQTNSDTKSLNFIPTM